MLGPFFSKGPLTFRARGQNLLNSSPVPSSQTGQKKRHFFLKRFASVVMGEGLQSDLITFFPPTHLKPPSPVFLVLFSLTNNGRFVSMSLCTYATLAKKKKQKLCFSFLTLNLGKTPQNHSTKK